MRQPPQSRLPALYNATPAKRVRAGGKVILSAITTHPCVFATSPPLVRAGALPSDAGQDRAAQAPTKGRLRTGCPHGRPAPGITRKQLRATVGSATSRSPKTPKTRLRGPLPRRGPPGCPRRGLPAPTARPRRCGAQRRHRPRRPPSTVLLGASPADAHHGPAARVTATERYTHMATLQMTDASQRMSELGYRDERFLQPKLPPLVTSQIRPCP
jgi:hypothetical protein